MIINNRKILIIGCLTFFFSFLGGYWGFFVRPYLWIEGGHMNTAVISVKSPEKGILKALFAQEGESVGKGSLLLTIENSQVKGNLEANQKALAELRRDEIFYKNQSELAMQSYLADLGVRSQPEIDQHLQKLQSAQVKTKQIQEQIDLLVKEQANLQHRETMISVTSPCQGIVAEQNKSPGEFLESDQCILSLFDTNNCWIETAVSEKDLSAIHLGQAADVYFTAYPNQVWQGTVSWIGSTTLSKKQGTDPVPNEEKIAVKIALSLRESAGLKPGLSATIRLHI